MFCDYRITSPSGAPAVGPLAEALAGFQALFSITFDTLAHGPKQRLRVSEDIAELTQLHLSRAYAGSVGVVLTLPAESQGQLFDSPRLAEAARTMSGRPLSQLGRNRVWEPRSAWPAALRNLRTAERRPNN